MAKYVTEINYKPEWSNETFKLMCQYSRYVYGGINLQLMEMDEELGFPQPFMTASVCVDGLNDDEIAIKNYSENEGILDVLIENGVITTPHRYVQSGFVTIPVCHLKEVEDKPYQVPFKAPCGLTESQAREVMDYMETYYRMQDVSDLIKGNGCFDKLSDEEKTSVLEGLACQANEEISNGGYWQEPTENAVNHWLYVNEGDEK